jgi:glucosyl-dolichyl phosphate glucuronosyltransferase
MIKISAVICTYNRPQELKNAVESLLNQSLDGNEYEIVVINNGPPFYAENIIAQFNSTTPLIRYAYEEKLGLSYARNKGIQEAMGKYIAFLDDDAIANRDWLKWLLTAFEETTPAPDIVGGRISIMYTVKEKPKYVTKELEDFLGTLDYGDKQFFITELNWRQLYSGNLAVKKDAVKKTGYFDPQFGRRGKLLFSGEETLFLRKAFRGGCIILYEPLMRITHVIPKERLRRISFMKQLFMQGISMYLLEKELGELKKNRVLYCVLICRGILGDVKSLFFERKRFFVTVLNICRKAGRICGAICS